MDLDEVERALASSFLRLRIRDESIPAAPEGPTPPPDTVLGAFLRDMTARIEVLEKAQSSADSQELDDLRHVLRLGLHLLEGRQVTL
jgi:hypothetical protein